VVDQARVVARMAGTGCRKCIARLSHERQEGGTVFTRRRLIRIPVRAGCPGIVSGVTANAGPASPCRA